MIPVSVKLKKTTVFFINTPNESSMVQKGVYRKHDHLKHRRPLTPTSSPRWNCP